MKTKKCECGKKMKTFRHRCPNPNNSTYVEIKGCPIHDDYCSVCCPLLTKITKQKSKT